MALSDILNIGSKALGFGSMVNPALAPFSMGLNIVNSLVQSQNKDNDPPKKASQQKIRTGDPLENTDIMKFDREGLMSMTTPRAIGEGRIGSPSKIPGLEVSKADPMADYQQRDNLKGTLAGITRDVSNIDWNEDFVQLDRISDQFLPNALNPNNVGANNNLGPILNNGITNPGRGISDGAGEPLTDTEGGDSNLKTSPTGIAKTFSDVNNLNKVSAGLSAVGAVGSLINEVNAKPPRFAPVTKASRVNLNSDTSSFENASEARTDKLYRSTLSSLINRGLSPVMANAVAGSMKNNASNETLAKAEQFRTQTENQEAGMNAEVSARNANAMNQHNQYKESMQAQYNQMAGQNISSSLATLAQIPAGYAESLMGSEMFKQYLLNQ